MPITIVAEVIEVVVLGSAIGGSVASWCNDHPEDSGCIGSKDKRDDILGLKRVPQIFNAPEDTGSGRRADVGPCGVPAYNFAMCNTSVQSLTVPVNSSIPASGVAQFDNIPPECMDLLPVMVTDCDGDGPRAVPCGSACMQWTGLTDGEFATLSNTLKTN